jgi:hypothetical protein
MTQVWRLRIAIARYLLGRGPQGYRFYVRNGDLLVRRRGTPCSEMAEVAERIFAISPPVRVTCGCGMCRQGETCAGSNML